MTAGAVASPHVSILLPVRDADATIDSCLRSILRQTLPSWECIAVDDGSQDGTAGRLAEYAAREPRLSVIAAGRRGLVEALNLGLRCCRAPFIARMDADDVMRRHRLERQVRALEADAGLAAVGSHVRMWPRAALTAGRRSYEQWLNGLHGPDDIARDAFVECPIAHPTLMARAGVLTSLSYRDAPWPEDYDLILRMLEAGHRVGVVAARLVAWRDGPSRLSRTDARYGLDRFTACRAYFLARGFLAGAPEYVLWGYGDTGKALRPALAAEGRRATHIIEVHRGRIGQRIAGAEVIGLGALASVRGRRIVVSVAGEAARAEIRAHLAAHGFIELRDFVCAA